MISQKGLCHGKHHLKKGGILQEKATSLDFQVGFCCLSRDRVKPPKRGIFQRKAKKIEQKRGILNPNAQKGHFKAKGAFSTKKGISRERRLTCKSYTAINKAPFCGKRGFLQKGHF